MLEGPDEIPFFTGIMVKHQRLENENIFITKVMIGSAIEISGNVDLMLEYRNVVGRDLAERLDEAQLIPSQFTPEAFAKKHQKAIRYLSKNNLKFARLPILKRMFPDGTVLVIIRHPAA